MVFSYQAVLASRATFSAAAIVGLLTFLPISSAANPLDVYGVGARGAAMSSAQTASAEGPAAIYYNLGALTLTEPGVSVGAFTTFNNAQILLKDRPAGYDVPDLGANSTALPSEKTLNKRKDTESIDNLHVITVGATTSLGIDNFRAGLLIALPIADLYAFNTHFPDERERYYSNQLRFELIDKRLHRISIDLGLAHQLTDWVSVGIGGTYSPGASVATNVFLADPTDQANVEINANVTTTNSWGILAGLLFALPADISLGVSYRGATEFRIKGANNLQLHGIDTDDEKIAQNINWVPTYTPSSLSIGLAKVFGSTLVTADARYTRWSDYRDTHNARPEFRDRIAYRLGAEYAYSETANLRIGTGLVPSPIPDQTGRTNYIDNTRLLGSVGSSQKFTFASLPFEASWFLQFQYLLRRTTDKNALVDDLGQYPACKPGEKALCDEIPDSTRDQRTGQPIEAAKGLQTDNPGFPGFTSGGWIGAVGFEVRY